MMNKRLPNFRRIFRLILVVGLLLSVSQVVGQVGMWDIFEASLSNTGSYGDPYSGVDLDVTYTAPSGKTTVFWGFYDGGSTWKIRFIPDELGTWNYQAVFSDGTPGASGSFECVASDIPGMLSLDEVNPQWFGYKGGNHVFLRSFHAGDRFFAANWPDSDRQAFLDWAQAQGYNLLSIASFFLNRNVAGRGAGWDTPALWPLDAAEYRKAEAIMDQLAERRIHISPFAGFIGQDCVAPTGDTDRRRYVKYTLARFAPYWNIIWNVAGPEPLAFPEKYGNQMSEAEVEKLGGWIKEMDPFGHPIGVHNGDGHGDRFIDNAWLTYSILQGAKGADLGQVRSYMLDNHKAGAALFAQECFWPGNIYGHIGADDLDLIRKKANVFAMSAAVVNFADMNGNSSSGFSGNLDVNSAEMHPAIHPAVNGVWDFFESIPWYRMNPDPAVADRGYALAKEGEMYLVYLPDGGSVNVGVAPGTYRVTWVDAQNPMNGRQDGGTTSDGAGLTAPAGGDDWLAYLVKEGLIPVREKTADNSAVYTLKLAGAVSASVRFSLPPEAAIIIGRREPTVDIYGISGAQVAGLRPENNIVFPERPLKPGVYSVRINLGNFSAVNSFVVLAK